MLIKLIKDRKVREDLKDKVEVVMAVFVLTGFVYKKIKEKKEEKHEDSVHIS